MVQHCAEMLHEFRSSMQAVFSPSVLLPSALASSLSSQALPSTESRGEGSVRLAMTRGPTASVQLSRDQHETCEVSRDSSSVPEAPAYAGRQSGSKRKPQEELNSFTGPRLPRSWVHWSGPGRGLNSRDQEIISCGEPGVCPSLTELSLQGSPESFRWHPGFGFPPSLVASLNLLPSCACQPSVSTSPTSNSRRRSSGTHPVARKLTGQSTSACSAAGAAALPDGRSSDASAAGGISREARGTRASEVHVQKERSQEGGIEMSPAKADALEVSSPEQDGRQTSAQVSASKDMRKNSTTVAPAAPTAHGNGQGKGLSKSPLEAAERGDAHRSSTPQPNPLFPPLAPILLPHSQILKAAEMAAPAGQVQGPLQFPVHNHSRDTQAQSQPQALVTEDTLSIGFLPARPGVEQHKGGEGQESGAGDPGSVPEHSQQLYAEEEEVEEESMGPAAGGGHISTAAQLVAGGVAGAVSKTCTAPLARLTILFQVQGMEDAAAVRNTRPSIWQEARRILSEEGFMAFWKGNTVTIIHRLPYSAINFFAYETYKKNLEEMLMERYYPDDGDDETDDAVLTSLSVPEDEGMQVANAEDPVSQLHPHTHRHHHAHYAHSHSFAASALATQQASLSIHDAGGTHSLMEGQDEQGLGASVAPMSRESLSPAMEALRHDVLDAAIKLLAGGGAGCTAATLTYPLDLVRTRLAAQRHSQYYKGIMGTLATIARDEGFLGLYKGMGATLLGVGPNLAINFCVYETVKAKWIQSHPETPQPLVSLGCGSLAGICSSTATFPLDLIRRRMQLEGAGGGIHVAGYRPRGILQMFAHIVRTEGFWALYRGIVPEYWKVVPGVSIAFMTYEFMKRMLMTSSPPPKHRHSKEED